MIFFRISIFSHQASKLYYKKQKYCTTLLYTLYIVSIVLRYARLFSCCKAPTQNSAIDIVSERHVEARVTSFTVL